MKKLISFFFSYSVFFLLTYLGRKSIAMNPSRTTVIDAILKTLATLLVPLSENAENHNYHNDDLTGSKTDFQLISWLLLFLSVCLDDGIDKKEQSAIRWEFMSGESDMSKTRPPATNNSGRSFSRSFKKRFLQNKQNNTCALFEKICFVPNDQKAQLTSHIEMALKQQENLIKKHNVKLNQLQSSMDKLAKSSNNLGKSSGGGAQSNKPTSGGGNNSSQKSTSTATSATTETIFCAEEQPFDKGLRAIKTAHTIVVVRGLIGLLLAMDYTCNMDLFLLTCKVSFKYHKIFL